MRSNFICPLAYTALGVFVMCRKSHLQGCCLIAFGVGLMVGHSLESWFLCVCGGVALAVLGLCAVRRKI